MLVATKICQLDITRGVEFERVLCREPRLTRETLASSQGNILRTESREDELSKDPWYTTQEAAPQSFEKTSFPKQEASSTVSSLAERMRQHCSTLAIPSILVALCACAYWFTVAAEN